VQTTSLTGSRKMGISHSSDDKKDSGVAVSAAASMDLLGVSFAVGEANTVVDDSFFSSSQYVASSSKR